MTQSMAAPGPVSTTLPTRGLAGRIVGVLTSPRDTYAQIAERPRWLGMAAVVLVLMVTPSIALMSTEVGRRALLDQQVQAIEAFGQTLNDAQYQTLQRYAALAPYVAAVNALVVLPLAAAVIAGVLIGIFGGLLGGDASFVQVFAVVIGSGVVLALRSLFSTPLDYARESLSSPTTLNAVLPFFEDNTFAARALGAIDLFMIWWLLNLAIGVGVVYKRRTTPIATTLLLVYFAIGLTIALARSLLSGA